MIRCKTNNGQLPFVNFSGHFKLEHTVVRSRETAVGTPGLRAGKARNHGSSPGRVKTHLFSKMPKSRCGTKPPSIQWLLEGGRCFPGAKKPWRQADHSSLSSVEVKNEQNYTAIPPYDFKGCTGTTLLLLYVLRYTVAVTTCRMQ